MTGAAPPPPPPPPPPPSRSADDETAAASASGVNAATAIEAAAAAGGGGDRERGGDPAAPNEEGGGADPKQAPTDDAGGLGAAAPPPSSSGTATGKLTSVGDDGAGAAAAAAQHPQQVATADPNPTIPSASATAATAATSTTTATATSSLSSTAAPAAPATATTPLAAPSAKRLYRSKEGQWVTRDIAALDFLLGIPLESEAEIVHSGWLLMHRHRQQLNADYGSAAMMMMPDDSSREGDDDGERQLELQQQQQQSTAANAANAASAKQQQAKQQQQQSPRKPQKKLKWWEKWVMSNHPSAVSSSGGAVSGGSDSGNNENDATSGSNNKNKSSDQLERPTHADKQAVASSGSNVLLVEGGGGVGALSSRGGGAPAPPHPGSVGGYKFYNVAPPGRRLEGDRAILVQIPLKINTVTKQRSIARQAAVREWEINTAHGLSSAHATPMLDGRLFFSASGSYPLSVFSTIRYEPRKEEAKLRRQKLEARGGGGSQYILPSRDWRGISYRSLLPRSRTVEKENKAFNRFLRRETQRRHSNKDNSHDQSNSNLNLDDGGNSHSQHLDEGGFDDLEDDAASTSSSSVSSEDSDVYVPGLLDDPEMVLGRHRNVMIGDRVTGPVVASTIQFVEPALLKLELNKQFRERFDGWEPPKSARKYIGAKVVEGRYVLMDPTEDVSYEGSRRRQREGSVTSMSSASEQGGQSKEKQLRMPPSLTLSKIRSLKNQAVVAAVNAGLEIGTVALACVYFERLCLDCRVDKSNRRLSFAACLLLATKLNEPNTSLVMQTEETSSKDDKSNMTTRLQALVRPNTRSNTMFAVLLEFFTQEWNLSLKSLFDAEWGVFAALGFSLLATPSQVAFHFKRLMKTLEWNPLTYLDDDMYNQWQAALKNEEERRKERERRRDIRRQRKQEQILNLRLEIESDLMHRKNQDGGSHDDDHHGDAESPKQTMASRKTPDESPSKIVTAASRIKLFNRFSMRRSNSTDRISQSDHNKHPTTPGLFHHPLGSSHFQHKARITKRADAASLSTSPSMPAITSAFPDTGVFAIDIPDHPRSKSETSSIAGSVASSEQDAAIFV